MNKQNQNNRAIVVAGERAAVYSVPALMRFVKGATQVTFRGRGSHMAGVFDAANLTIASRPGLTRGKVNFGVESVSKDESEGETAPFVEVCVELGEPASPLIEPEKAIIVGGKRPENYAMAVQFRWAANQKEIWLVARGRNITRAFSAAVQALEMRLPLERCETRWGSERNPEGGPVSVVHICLKAV